MIPFIGLTGGIASGKTTAAAQFASLGVQVVDADDVGHGLYGPDMKVTKQIKREFGEDFVDAEGAVDRARLRQAVFADSRLRKRLEAITHPMIGKECMIRMSAATGTYGLLVAPLLFEASFVSELLVRKLVIDCKEERQFEHGLSRGRFSAEQVRAAMKAQMGREGRLQRADDVIENNGDMESFQQAVRDQHEIYQEMFGAAHSQERSQAIK